MACPTCDHTMAILNDVAAYRIFLCPRCGTVKTETYTGIPEREVKVFVPKLVEQCREFESSLKNSIDPEAAEEQDVVLGGISEGAYEFMDEWTRLGIAEAIHPPDDRPMDNPPAPR